MHVDSYSQIASTAESTVTTIAIIRTKESRTCTIVVIVAGSIESYSLCSTIPLLNLSTIVIAFMSLSSPSSSNSSFLNPSCLPHMP